MSANTEYYGYDYDSDESLYRSADSTPMDPPSHTNLKDFVKSVYQLSDVEFAYISSKTWHLQASVSEYQQAVDDANSGEMYTALRRILEDLFIKLQADGHDLRISIEALQSAKPSRELSHGFFFAAGTVDSPVRWSTCKAFLKLHISSDRREVTVQTEPTEHSCSSDRSAMARIGDGPQAAAAQMTNSPIGTKRKLGSSAHQNGPRKRCRHDLFKREAPQAVGHALELMSSTCRRWATGLVVEDTCVWAQYYDRMGAVFAEPFDFVAEPTKLALLALAIGKCGLAEAGFEPYLTADIGGVATKPLPSLGDAELFIPQSGGQEGQGVEIIQGIPDECYSHFKITGDALFTYPTASGRGTHVLPGYLVNVPSKESSEGQQAHGANALVGESRTAVDTSSNINASKDTARRDLLPKAMVAKLSWPMEQRPCLEAQTINSLVNKIPWMKHHLPQIHCAITLKGKSMGIPRHLFRDMTTAYKLEQRYFTLLFTDRYQHLWDVKTVADFQLAYIDIVECHYAATKFGKVLHRDISENNLLWTKSTKRVVGILNDWDLATPVDAIGNSTNHRTGTGPFMSLDLLGRVPPIHLYRHDLESLFYALIWAVVHYNIGAPVPYTRVVNEELEKWNGRYLDALSAKTLFLNNTEPVLQCIRPAFERLRPTWIKSLCDLFQKAQSNRVLLATSLRQDSSQGETQVLDESDAFAPLDEGQGPKDMNVSDDESDEENESEKLAPPPAPAAPARAHVNIDFETLGGCLTFENFMAALNWKPRVIRKKYLEDAKQLLAA